MSFKLMVICLILGLLLLCPVSASKEVIVDEKRVECGGCLNAPYFIISQLTLDHGHREYTVDEYVVGSEWYYKLNIGDKIVIDENNVDITGKVNVIKKV